MLYAKERSIMPVAIRHDSEFIQQIAVASQYCTTGEGENIFQGVTILEDKIVSCNGYIGIEIESTCIPKALKNTQITWDSKKNIVLISNGTYKDNTYMMDMYHRSITESAIITKEILEQMLIVRETDVLLQLNSENILAFEKPYMETILNDLPDDTNIKIGWSNNSEPIVFISETTKMIIFPQ